MKIAVWRTDYSHLIERNHQYYKTWLEDVRCYRPHQRLKFPDLKVHYSKLGRPLELLDKNCKSEHFFDNLPFWPREHEHKEGEFGFFKDTNWTARL